MKIENPWVMIAVMRRVSYLISSGDSLAGALWHVADELEEYYLANIGKEVKKFSLPLEKD